MGITIGTETLDAFEQHLKSEERSNATREKYMFVVRKLVAHLDGAGLTKEMVLSFKQMLMGKGFADRTINAYLAGVNSLLHFLGMDSLRVRNLKIQKTTYIPENRILTKDDYNRLINATSGGRQLRMIMETIAGTGIRVSELMFFTVENIAKGSVRIHNKGKTRTVLVPGKLRKLLLDFARKNGIRSGVIFVGKKGQPLDRSVIWARMKKLCDLANVAASKVFPHNLRRLFARGFYKVAKDIVKLADVLGHSSIDTTRFYLLETGREHIRIIEKMGLVV